ncbi:unnamed protein product, partial [Ectocarpus sp. 12 AP-2014]
YSTAVRYCKNLDVSGVVSLGCIENVCVVLFGGPVSATRSVHEGLLSLPRAGPFCGCTLAAIGQGAVVPYEPVVAEQSMSKKLLGKHRRRGKVEKTASCFCHKLQHHHPLH